MKEISPFLSPTHPSPYLPSGKQRVNRVCLLCTLPITSAYYYSNQCRYANVNANLTPLANSVTYQVRNQFCVHIWMVHQVHQAHRSAHQRRYSKTAGTPWPYGTPRQSRTRYLMVGTTRRLRSAHTFDTWQTTWESESRIVHPPTMVPPEEKNKYLLSNDVRSSTITTTVMTKSSTNIYYRACRQTGPSTRRTSLG